MTGSAVKERWKLVLEREVGSSTARAAMSRKGLTIPVYFWEDWGIHTTSGKERKLSVCILHFVHSSRYT